MKEPIVFTLDERYSRSIFGFWLYLLTDCIMFGMIFATYLVLSPNTAGGPSPKTLFHLPHILGETILLLTSSLFAGIARVEAFRNEKNRTAGLFFLVFILGAAFLTSAYFETSHMIEKGYSWQTSAFLSSFFTLIWTHGAHILAGMIWAIVLILQIWKRGITSHTFRRLSCFTLFWQFLAIIWIFTFTIVYLMGVGGV